MRNDSPKKMEVFLWLTERQTERLDFESPAESDPREDFFSVFTEQLPAAQAEEFRRLRTDFQAKSAEEKRNWLGQIENFIGSDEVLVDDAVHWSHVDAALQKETLSVRKVLRASLPETHQKHFIQNTDEANGSPVEVSRRRQQTTFEKTIRRTFVGQFVALDDLPKQTAFDRLKGAQLARLIRLAAIREVAYACLRIEAVESVTAFLRRFAAEDARAIAAQISQLPRVSEERLSFAEDLVQAALEIEPQPSAAMLDLLGIRLVGILLCDGVAERVAYAQQKLPLEASPKLSEIIETQCRKTSPELQREIAREIEQLAEKL